MLNTWNAVATLDRMFDDVMGSAFGTATSSRSFEPAVDVRTSDSSYTLPETLDEEQLTAELAAPKQLNQ